MDLMKFFEIAMGLKDVERAGWKERGVKDPETSSEHSFMVALMTLVLGKGRKLDMDRAVRMALVHDLPEAIVGDIITKENWKDGGSMWNREKVSRERPAMARLASLAGNPGMLALWEEFEGQKTPESRFVKDIDKLSGIIQATEYHKEGNYKKPLPPFWDERGVASVRDPELKKFLQSFLKTLKK